MLSKPNNAFNNGGNTSSKSPSSSVARDSIEKSKEKRLTSVDHNKQQADKNNQHRCDDCNYERVRFKHYNIYFYHDGSRRRNFINKKKKSRITRFWEIFFFLFFMIIFIGSVIYVRNFGNE